MVKAKIGEMLEGCLFKYGPLQSHVAFVSGKAEKHFVLVGGLGDGLLFAPYCLSLADHLNANGWSLVQTLLSSSHTGYGVGSLDKDAEELHLLVTHLGREMSSKGFVLMGHSTGCQDTVRYCQKYCTSSEAPPALGFILQAPVSDREAQSTKPDSLVRERLDAAQLMVANGEAEEILFRDWEMQGAPICSRRFLALVAKGGDDDMFSSDFADSEFKEKLGHLSSTPTLLLMGDNDEFVPPTVDKLELVKRMAAAIGPSAKPVLVPSGKHNLKGSEQELIRYISEFLASLPSSRC